MELARERLAAFFADLDLSNPGRARDALVEFLPILADEYGNVAAVAAAEWYESVRRSDIGGAFTSVLGDPIDRERVEGTVRWAADGLWTDRPETTLELLSGSLQRFVLYSSRVTVARNVLRDPAKPRFGRVPSGEKTCAWCSMLASRGFVYVSKGSAGDLGRGVGDDFHDDCDCQVVMEWDRHEHHIAGYDPDAMYAQYLAARKASGSGDPKVIAEYLRRMFPDSFTDGVRAPLV